MKRIILIVIMAVFSVNTMAQYQTADIGAYVGGTYPFGDYSSTMFLSSVKMNYGGFFRFNFNPRYSLRVNFLTGKVGATGEINHIPAIFNKQVTDLAVLFEFNYLEYMLGVDTWNISSFISLGAGMMYYPNWLGVAQVTPSIPFGVGLKYSITDRIGVSVEYSMRKLFNDALDNSDNPLYQVKNMPDVNDAIHNNDYVGYLGVTLVYKIFLSKMPCPVYENFD